MDKWTQIDGGVTPEVLDRALRMEAVYNKMVAEVHGPVSIKDFRKRFNVMEVEREVTELAERLRRAARGSTRS